jgi:hypothetical protein
VVTTKANSIGEIGTKEEKGHASGGRKKGKEVKKTIANPLLKVDNAFVEGKYIVEEFGPISSSPLKYREENASCRGERSPVTNGPS